MRKRGDSDVGHPRVHARAFPNVYPFPHITYLQDVAVPVIKIEGQAAVSNAALLIKVRAFRACYMIFHIAEFGAVCQILGCIYLLKCFGKFVFAVVALS